MKRRETANMAAILTAGYTASALKHKYKLYSKKLKAENLYLQKYQEVL